MNYPNTKKVNHVDAYFEHHVSDPYRWLEDDQSTETANWIEQQNQFTQNHLQQIPYKDELRKRLTELSNYERVERTFEVNNFIYFFHNNGLQNQPVLYRCPMSDPSSRTLFLDPNTFSEDGTTALTGIWFSKDGTRCAYLKAKGGADWCAAVVIDTASRQELDTLSDIKFSGICWLDNNGFFYATYDKPSGSKLSAKTDQHKVYYHKIGTPQTQDQLYYGRNESEKSRYVSIKITSDKQYLILSLAQSSAQNRLCVTKLHEETPEYSFFTSQEDEAQTYYVTTAGDEFLLYSNLGAPNGRIVAVRYPDISPPHWKEVVPEAEHPINIHQFVTSGNFMFVSYQNGPCSNISQFDKKGKKIRDINPPQKGQIYCYQGRSEAKNLYYRFTNYLFPSQTFQMDLENGETTVFFSTKNAFDHDQYVSTEIRYPSADGTLIPMIITHRKDIILDGQNPTMVTGYGGFRICRSPVYSPAIITWIEQGGVFAVANLRGGGEFGKRWHDLGRRLNKQNVFDDFIAACEYLVQKQYTCTDRLGIMGGSNGGLLVGACVNQRPDLFRVALPAVGVLDMLRYHKFTAGAGWAYDYGTSEESPEMFSYLHKYSPLHNIKQGTKYPSVMVTTGDHDDRVVPAHSFKYAATLQEQVAALSPQLLRVKINAGHGAGQSTQSMIDERTDCWAFALWEMGVTQLR